MPKERVYREGNIPGLATVYIKTWGCSHNNRFGVWRSTTKVAVHVGPESLNSIHVSSFRECAPFSSSLRRNDIHSVIFFLEWYAMYGRYRGFLNGSLAMASTWPGFWLHMATTLPRVCERNMILIPL